MAELKASAGVRSRCGRGHPEVDEALIDELVCAAELFLSARRRLLSSACRLDSI